MENSDLFKRAHLVCALSRLGPEWDFSACGWPHFRPTHRLVAETQ
jgi:hypothetical protein